MKVIHGYRTQGIFCKCTEGIISNPIDNIALFFKKIILLCI